MKITDDMSNNMYDWKEWVSKYKEFNQRLLDTNPSPNVIQTIYKNSLDDVTTASCSCQ